MSNSILVSTRKGLFTVKRGRGGWSVSDGDFVGDNVTLTLHDPRDGTDYAALNHGHFGIKLHRRDKFVMSGSLVGQGKKHLAIILLAGQGPGMADGNVAMTE